MKNFLFILAIFAIADSAFSQAPANDFCGNAVLLTVNGASCGTAVTGNVASATQSAAPLLCGGATSTTANDVWYKFTATAASHIITVVGSASFDAVVELQNGACGTNIDCADATFSGGTEVINAASLTVGTTYFIRVYAYGSSVPSTTTFTICVTTPPPANDDCSGAAALTVYGSTCGGAVTGNVAGATQSITAAPCTGTASGDVWYSFIAVAASQTITVVGSANFDAVVNLRSGSCSGTSVSCADASANGGTEVINAAGLTVGSTYFVRVYHYWGTIPSTTTFTICVTTPAPANDNCSGAVSLTVYGPACGAAVTGNTAGATLSLAATCAGTADDDVWYKFTATAASHIITVAGSASFDAVVDLRSGACSGTNMMCSDATANGGIEVITATGLTVGNTYYVRVYSWGSTVPATTTFTICVTTPGPVNDDCSGAVPLTVYGSSCGGTITGNTAGATQSLAATCAGTADDDVWYKFTAAAAAQTITVVGSASFDAVVDLRSGNCNGTNINCADATGSGGTEVLNATGLTAGNIYYVRIYSWGSSVPATTTFTICVTTPAPANDNCSGASSLTVYGASCGGAVTGNTAGATQSLAATCAGTADDDIWYKFTATAAAHDITVIGSASFDAVVDLRSGSCNGTNMMCADLTPNGGTEVINAVGLTIGATYYIRVYSWGSSVPATTTFTICITTPVPPAPINDECLGAASLTVYGAACGAAVTGNVTGATQSVAAISCGNFTSTAANDIWYSFTATSSSHNITVVGSASFDAVVDLRSGSCSGSNVSCADGTTAGGTEVINATGLTAGTIYFVRVYNYGSTAPATPTFTICVTTPAPVNDNCSGATSLTVYGASCGGAASGNVASATQSLAATCAGTADDDVWYSFTATAIAHDVTVVGSASFDAVVDLRSGSCNGTNMMCADATANGGTEVIHAAGLTIGTTYYVRVYSWGSTVPATTTFTICVTTPVPPGPANDNCSNAISLTVSGASCVGAVTGDVASATQSIPAITCNNFSSTAANDIWYKFTAASTSHIITVAGSASFDAVLDMRSDSCNGPNIYCADATSNGGTEVINAPALIIGHTYYVRVYPYGGSIPATTTFTICVTTPPPANDNCSGAVPLTVYGVSCGGTVTGNVISATSSGVPVTPCTGTADDDVWYSFVATGASHIITVAGSASFDAVVDLRTGSCNGTNLMCADANGYGGTEVITAAGLTAGTTYYVRVYDYYSTVPATTTFTICVTTPAPLTPANDDCTGAVSLIVYGPSCGGVVTGNTASATQSIPALLCTGFTGTADDDVWYKFTATATSHNITVVGSANFDAVVDLRSGPCDGTNINCSDTTGIGGTEVITETGLTIGVTYYVRVYSYGSTVPSTTTFTICVTTPSAPPPANDNCSGAVALTVYGAACGAAVTGDVTGATQSLSSILCNGFTGTADDDIWYSFTATAAAHDITVVGSASFDAVVDLRTGSCNGTNINCADATGNGGIEIIHAAGLTVGTTYYVRVYSYGSTVPATPTFTICVTTPAPPVPANDDCAGAVSLTVFGASCGGAVTGNTASATQSIPAITCNGLTGTADDDVWYKFTATAAAHDITVVGSVNFNPVVDLRSGACSGINIDCADATLTGGTEVIHAIGLTVGTTYYVRVYDFGNTVPATTAFTICVTTPTSSAPANDNCSGAISLTVYGAACGGAVTGNVAGATQSLPGITCNGSSGTANDDVWYSFTATAATHIITVVGSASFDAVVDLRSGACTGTNVNCSDTSFSGGTEAITAAGLTIGNTYFVRVYDWYSGVPATTTFTICVTTPTPPVPANDNCSGAIPLTVYGASCGGTVTGNTASATQSIPAITCSGLTGSAEDDVWYSFTATAAAHDITVVGSTNFNAVVDLRSGACTGTNMDCADATLAGGTEVIHAIGLTIGSTYFVRVYDFGNTLPSTTVFTICVTTPSSSVPPNDDCSGAVSLTVYGASCGGAVTGDVSGATQSTAPITCNGLTGSAANDVWYSFTATAVSHNITVTGSSGFDAVVDLRTGICPTGTNIDCGNITTTGGAEVINATGLTIGTTYFVRVYNFGSTTPSTTTFTICITTPSSPAPANDNCSGATALTVYGVTCGGAVTGNVTGATQSLPAISCNGTTGTAEDDVWYSFVATAAAHDITVVGSAGFNPVIDLRSGVCTGANINCADATAVGGTEVINAAGLIIGSTYFVRVYDYGSTVPSTTTFTICITTPGPPPAAPANDECSSAVSLTVYGAVCGGTVTGDVAGATQSLPAILCNNSTSSMSNDVWYSFTATATAHTITVAGSAGFDAVIDLRSGVCPGANINCSDASFGGVAEILNASNLTIGTVYFVRVYNHGSSLPSTTIFSICITTPCIAPNTTVNPSSASICAGSSTSLTASGASSYSWSSAVGLNTTSGATVTANPTTTTTYTVTGTTNGCDGTQVITVTVVPTPTPTITQVGFLLTSSTGSNYQWYLDGVLIPGANLQNYVATQNGNYTVGTTNGVCSETSAPFPIATIGISKLADDKTNVVTIHPNPFSTSATIEIKGNIGNNDVIGIEIFDLLGRKVKNILFTPNQQVSIQNGLELKIERDEMPCGMYFYKLTNKNEVLGGGKFSIQ